MACIFWLLLSLERAGCEPGHGARGLREACRALREREVQSRRSLPFPTTTHANDDYTKRSASSAVRRAAERSAGAGSAPWKQPRIAPSRPRLRRAVAGAPCATKTQSSGLSSEDQSITSEGRAERSARRAPRRLALWPEEAQRLSATHFAQVVLTLPCECARPWCTPRAALAVELRACATRPKCRLPGTRTPHHTRTSRARLPPSSWLLRRGADLSLRRTWPASFAHRFKRFGRAAARRRRTRSICASVGSPCSDWSLCCARALHMCSGAVCCVFPTTGLKSTRPPSERAPPNHRAHLRPIHRRWGHAAVMCPCCRPDRLGVRKGRARST